MVSRRIARRIAIGVMLAAAAMLCLAACGSSQQSSSSNAGQSQGSQQSTASSQNAMPVAKGKTLVVCFSQTGHTQPIAQEAAAVLGADYFQIEAAQPYTSDDLNYNDRSTRASAEQDAVTARPAIANTVQSMDSYDAIVLCHPIWWGKAPRIICTFLESYDFSGKTIAELCTSGSSGIDDAQAELKQICPSANWLAGKRFETGATQAEVADWLNGLGLTATSAAAKATTAATTSPQVSKMQIEVNGQTFSAALDSTDAAHDFASRLPMTLDMDEFGGNEKSHFVDYAYPTVGGGIVSPIEAGDVMLYQNNCIVLFYGTHDNTEYSYVPLAKIDNPAGLAEAVGAGSATVTLTAA